MPGPSPHRRDSCGKLAIVAHHGQDNLGDETATQALVQNLQRLNPGGEIVCFSMNPADTERRFGVRAYAVRPGAEHSGASRSEAAPAVRVPEGGGDGTLRSSLAALAKRNPIVVHGLAAARATRAFLSMLAREVAFLPRSQRRLRGTRLLVVAGSNQLVDLWGGPWGYPLTLLRWVVQARLAGAKVAFVSIGAGPVDHAASWWFIRRALALATYISFRDEGSLRMVREHVPVPDAVVRPDMAYSHNEFRFRPEWQQGSGAARTIAINPMPVNDPRYWPDADPAAYDRYVATHAQLVSILAARGYRVVLFSTHPTDELVADDVRARLPPCISADVIRPRQPAELASCIRQADVIVATRFHGILFALACERPVVGISYFRKSHELMAAAGLEPFTVGIDAATAEWCAGAVERLLAQGDAILAQLQAHGARQRSELDDQYVELVRRWTAA